MPHEFIQKKVGGNSLQIARKQQKQLAYFTQSAVQQDVTTAYLNTWAERQFRSSEEFLNWVKTIFKTDNFLSFYKYLRFPLPSSRLINDRIKPPLGRVFFAEDSFFNYTIKGEQVEQPESLNVTEFNSIIFNAMLFRHNDILVTDLRDVNMPMRNLVSIDNVVALESKDGVISRLAYTASITVIRNEIEELVTGVLFIDDKQYIFFEKENLTPLVTIPHDLGECPADYITKEAFGDDDIVRQSIFTFAREELEEYVFLKTLQKMAEPNGAIPVTTQLDFKETKDNKDQKGSSDKEPMTINEIGSQRARIVADVNKSNSPLQAGTVIKIPPIRKVDGSIDIDAVKNFINFFHAPVESLQFINTRIKEIEQSIIIAICGDFSETQEEAKNELQVSKSYVSKQDKLRILSWQLTRIRNRSDFKMLALEFGRDAIAVDCFYGSDFFLESQDDLYKLFNEAPNPIERKNILIRLAKNRSRFNKDRGDRDVILQKLLPYSSDEDFDKAITRGVDNETFQYQIRFDHWIGLFQAQFGDILEFFNNLEGTNSEKLILINNLILQIITNSTNTIES